MYERLNFYEADRAGLLQSRGLLESGKTITRRGLPSSPFPITSINHFRVVRMQLWLKTKELPTGKKSHRGAGKCGQWGKREMGNGERNTVDVKGEAHTSQVRKLLFALFLSF